MQTVAGDDDEEADGGGLGIGRATCVNPIDKQSSFCIVGRPSNLAKAVREKSGKWKPLNIGRFTEA